MSAGTSGTKQMQLMSCALILLEPSAYYCSCYSAVINTNDIKKMRVLQLIMTQHFENQTGILNQTKDVMIGRHFTEIHLSPMQ